MAKSKPKPTDPAADEAKIREHAAKLGLAPAVVDRLVKLLLFLVQFLPNIIALFAATKTKKDAEKFLKAASPEAVDAERAAIERDFIHALEPHAALEPGKMGGPITEALLSKALKSLVDFLGRQTDAGAKLIDDLINRIVTTP